MHLNRNSRRVEMGNGKAKYPLYKGAGNWTVPKSLGQVPPVSIKKKSRLPIRGYYNRFMDLFY